MSIDSTPIESIASLVTTQASLFELSLRDEDIEPLTAAAAGLGEIVRQLRDYTLEIDAAFPLRVGSSKTQTAKRSEGGS